MKTSAAALGGFLLGLLTMFLVPRSSLSEWALTELAKTLAPIIGAVLAGGMTAYVALRLAADNHLRTLAIEEHKKWSDQFMAAAVDALTSLHRAQLMRKGQQYSEQELIDECTEAVRTFSRLSLLMRPDQAEEKALELAIQEMFDGIEKGTRTSEAEASLEAKLRAILERERQLARSSLKS